jgi:hypothetical protein
MKKIGGLILVGLLILIMILIVRTTTLKSLQNPIEIPVSNIPEIPGSSRKTGAIHHL